MILVAGTLIISCSKDEALVKDQTSKTMDYDPYESPYANRVLTIPHGYESAPGIDAKPITAAPIEWPDSVYSIRFPFERINSVTQAYKDETCLVDISKLEDDHHYNVIKNGKLSMTFYHNHLADRSLYLSKMKSGSGGRWSAPWGALPMAEQEAPDVLYTNYGIEDVIIMLSKPCIEFGLEVAPNSQNRDYSFSASFGDYPMQSKSGFVSRTTAKTPSGAALIAIKATEPFTLVHLSFDGSPTLEGDPGGFAIANLRYKLAK